MESPTLTATKTHLVATATRPDTTSALRLMLAYNWMGWNTTRCEKLEDGDYLVQLTRSVNPGILADWQQKRTQNER